MTKMRPATVDFWIIPYQELLGNYDALNTFLRNVTIIPYQELLGNYDAWNDVRRDLAIIPYQELLGNYDMTRTY